VVTFDHAEAAMTPAAKSFIGKSANVRLTVEQGDNSLFPLMNFDVAFYVINFCSGELNGR